MTVKRMVKNGRIVTPYAVLEGHVITVDGGRISGIYADGAVSEAGFDDVVDAGGLYVSPGFIDIHNHGNSDHDAMEATFDALESMAKFHAKNGVTGFLATTVTASFDDTSAAIRNAADYMQKQTASPDRAQLLGIYIEGPYINVRRKGAQPRQYIKDPSLSELKEYINAASGAIRIVALAPELPGAPEAVGFLKSLDITVSAAHTEATFEEMLAGLDHGITHVTHLFNAMRPFSHREPGPIGAALTDDRAVCEIICDGIHLHPAAMKLALKAKGREKIALVSDAMMAAGLAGGVYSLGGQKVIVKGSEARLEDGTIAGSTLTLNRAVYNMVHMTGATLIDAVYMASLVPAQAIGMDHRKGSIEVGKDADLILFDDELDVFGVL